ncbi:MAG: CBS domain-containing protein, partial [Gammaproteobacteria bacterium]
LYTIAPDDSVFSALEKMAEHNIGALPVVDKDKLVGLISERDYARKVILLGHTSRELKVRDIMSKQVMCASPDDDVEHCMAIMTETRERHLPVLENGKLIGLVSIGDLVKTIIGEQQFVIEQMTSYIAG